MKKLTLVTLLLSVPLFACASDQTAPDAHGGPGASASGHGGAPGAKTGGWEALSNLQTGNMRFYEGHPLHPNVGVARRETVANGQHPHSIIVSCSDSRAAPELIFDQGLGDVFTVRNAGNLMTTEAIASIEYAIEHLGSKLLIVMGHESCGAVGAAIGSSPSVSNGSESLDVLVRRIRGNLSSSSVTAGASDKSYRVGVKENVTANLRDLYVKSEIVRLAVARGGLILGQGIYSLKSGRVEFWDVGRPVEGAIAPVKNLVRDSSVKEEVISDPLVSGKSKKKSQSGKSDHGHAH